MVRECDHKSVVNRVKDQYNDTLTSYVNKDGVYVSTIRVMKEESHENFLELKSEKESVKQLQAEVKEYKKKLKDATYVHVITKISNSDKTEIIATDTIKTDSIVYVYPTYLSTKDTEWVKWNINASKDSVSVDLKLVNKFSIVQINKRKSLFSPRNTVIELKNLNPYTETEELQRFTVEKRKSNIIIGPQIGFAINGSIMIGIGVTYPLLRL